MITLFSDEKICFWVMTVNLTRHWGGDKNKGKKWEDNHMMAWDDSVMVTGTAHDRRFTAMTFCFSYLYLLSKRGLHFVFITAAHTLLTQIHLI